MIGLISPKLQAHKSVVGEWVEMYLQKNMYTILDMLQPLEDNIETLWQPINYVSTNIFK